MRTEERPAAPLSRPYARPRSPGAHHVAISRLAGAKPIDCAQPFKAHGIASVQKPLAKLPSQFSAQEATAPRAIKRRPPARSAKCPLTTWEAPWTMRPAPLIQPTSVALSPSSARIPGIAQPRF